MQLIDEFATPAELTGYARAALADRPENAFSLDRWLPNRTINDLSYRFTRGGGGLTEAATFRAYDASADVGVRPGGARVSGELPPISRKIPVGEYERIKRRNIDTQNAEIRDAMLDDGVRLARQIEARMELARGEAIFNASVALNENGVQASVDFGRAAGHTVTAGTVWSDPAADVIGNFQTWLEVYNDTNGGDPDSVLISRAIWTALKRNTQLRGLSTTGATAPSILTDSLLAAILADHGIPPLVRYDAKVNVSGVSTRITPNDKLAFMPAQGDTLGQTLWGVPVEADDARYGLAGDAAGVAVGAYKTEDPQTVWTRATAIALPVVAAPDLTFVADVL
ncbi:major capsid protein [Streptomyces sp. ITFR-6]|uniref:major capsid protein n=1 Tax=Streptomyces sp. ITFR-6 TaxID=3075197 RepID=UPI002889A021|nr:major capsid protein [Streptomyces sp. ITFR-6]WNI28669.1 major capsid protein [Streptomyces sp. ITFR-6]